MGKSWNNINRPTKLTCSKVEKTWFFGLFLVQKSVFMRFYPGKLRLIISKPLLIDSTVKITFRKMNLESLAFPAENSRKSFYYLNYWQTLKALNLMSLQRRRERYTIIHMWKVLYGKCPNDVNIQFSATLRHGQKAVISTLNKCSSQSNQTLYDNSFAVIGPWLWILIPLNMHTIEDPLHLQRLWNHSRIGWASSGRIQLS